MKLFDSILCKISNKITNVFECLLSPLKRALIYFLIFSINIQSVFAAGIVDVNGGGASSHSNGVPVYNIAAPTNAGVSHNKFNEFNVDQNGLIINNLNMQNYNPGYESSLSGTHVEFNPNFGASNAASVILNEIVSNSVSELKGYTEIYGKKADYIVANPNGITCEGCGFVNTGRLSLITGSANMVDGDIQNFNITSNAVLQINGVGQTNFGLYADSSADLISEVIKIAGDVYANGDLALYSGNDKFDYKNKTVSSNNISDVKVAIDSTAIGGMRANNIKIIATGRGFGVNVSGDLVANMGDVEINANGDIVAKNIAAVSDANIKSESGNIKTSGGDVYARDINIDAAQNYTNDDDNLVVALNSLNLSAGNSITNIGKLNSGNLINLSAFDLHNYGQVMAGNNVDLSIDSDLINYRASAILSGGDIDLKIGRNLVNYKSEIYASGDINIQGRDDITLNPVNINLDASLYDNPYIAAEIIDTVTPPVLFPIPTDEVADIDIQYRLPDNSIVTIPAGTFGDTSEAGDRYVDANGYIFIVGTETRNQSPNPEYTRCMAAGDCVGDEPEFIYSYSYSGTDTITVKDKTADANGYHPILNASLIDVADSDNGSGTVDQNFNTGLESIPVQNGTNEYVSSTLDNMNPVSNSYVFNNNLMGNLLNWAGRIESGGDLEINANEIWNKSFDINTGASAADIERVVLRSKPTSSGWHVMWYEKIADLNLDSIAGQIIAGENMVLNGGDILNTSSVISSIGDMVLNATGSIENQTISEIVNLRTVEGARKWKTFDYRHYYRESNAQKRVYSSQRSTILSGGDLKLKSSSLINDQILDPLSGLGLGTNVPGALNNGFVNTRLPVGDNGIFVVRPDSKYLVQTNVSFINPNNFIGSDYFFDGLGGSVSSVDTTRILGDAAYETRIITDAYVQATGNHWTDNNGVLGSDSDMMKSFYDGAKVAAADMDLKIGVALTDEQIGNLQQDIIWYVEKEIDGYTVLVPELYLAIATMDSIDSGSGSRITGVTMTAENEYMLNTGTISATELLAIDTKDLINQSNDSSFASMSSGGNLSINANDVQNRSAEISGDTVNITADNLTNKTIVLSEDRSWAAGGDSGSEHIEIASYDAKISGDNGIDIVLTDTLQNTGATLESKSGDININANEVIFNTAVVHNKSTTVTSSDGFAKSSTNTKTSESVQNIGSDINAGGNLNIKTDGDATFAGTTVNAGGNADLDIGGDTNVLAVVDSSYEYEKTDKSSWGGLVRETSISEISNQDLKSSEINTIAGLSINTGNNLNLVASDINAGTDADITAGSNINIMAGTDTDSVYSYYEKTDYLSDAIKAAGALALAGATGGTSLLLVADDMDVGCSGGSCGVDFKIGSAKSSEDFTKTTTSIASAINVGGDLNMSAGDDINVKGSDIMVAGSGNVSAGGDINILETHDTVQTSSSKSETEITAGVSVGNSYVDVGYAAVNLYNAGDAVVKASEDLKHIKDLAAQGLASSHAVSDAELNLTMASLNLLNAELAIVSSAAGAASAASTSFGTGMYASASLNFETNENSFNSNSSTARGSQIFGENLTFTSNNNMTQIGSDVAANDTVIYDIANDLRVLSSLDIHKTDSDSRNINAGVSIGNNMVQVSAGYNESSNKTASTTHNNSTIEGDNIIIKTGNDAEFAGANVTATDRLDINVGGDLLAKSKQDEYYASGDNFGINAGFGWGDRGSLSGGFNTGNSNTDSRWTESQTTLTGGDVDITVADKTTITGGVIASDTDDLNLTTGDLVYNDLHDYERVDENGFGINASIGGSTDKGIANAASNGSTTITMLDTGSEKEQTTHATIGGGTITVGGDANPDLAGLNRDVENSQEVTKDLITGALDSSVTIDNRLVSDWGDIYDKHAQLDENLVVAGLGAYGTVEGVVKQAGDVITGDTAVENVADSWRAHQSGMATGLSRGQNAKAVQILKAIDDGTATPEQIQALADMTADGSANLVYSDTDENIKLYAADGTLLGEISRQGFNDLENNQGYVNLGNGSGTDAGLFLLTDAEERAHNYVGKDEDAAKSAAQNELKYFNLSSGYINDYTADSSFDLTKQDDWNERYKKDPLLLENTAKAQSVTGETSDSLTAMLAYAAFQAIRMGIITNAMQPGETYEDAKARLRQDYPALFIDDILMEKALLTAAYTVDVFSPTGQAYGTDALVLLGEGMQYITEAAGGEAVFDGVGVGLSLIPIGSAIRGAKKASSAAQVAGSLDNVTDVASVANKADNAADVASVANKADDVADMASVANKTDDVAKKTANIDRTEPRNLSEKLAMDEAKANPGELIIPAEKLGDPRYKNTHDKYKWDHKGQDDSEIIIHYFKDRKTQTDTGHKFKKSKTGVEIKAE